MSDCGRVIVRLAPQAAVRVDVTAREATRVMVPGMQGAPGTPGFDFIQSTPATVWTINHNLGLRPSVQAFTVGGIEMIGAIQHLSANVTTITFAVAVAGTARLL